MTYTRYGSLRLAEPPDPRPVLTWRQTLVLRAIKASVAEHGYSPTFRQIAEAARLSCTSAVWYQIQILTAKGYLAVDETTTTRRAVFTPRRLAKIRQPASRPVPPGPSRASVVMDRHACPECGAGQGELCVTASGKVTRDPHMARWCAADRARAAELEC